MSRQSRRRAGVLRLSACALVGATALTACSASQPSAPVVVTDAGAHAQLHGTDISDVIGRPELRLIDTTGRGFSLSARPLAEVTVLFFGYTRCPDLCPTTMADLAAARRLLPPTERARLQVVFVTEDPSRDTPTTLRAWLGRFDPSFVGLIGGNSATKRALAALKAPLTEMVGPHGSASSNGRPGAAAGASPAKPTSGAVEHSGSVYAFAGERVLVYTGGTTPKQYAEDFQTLLRA